MAGLKKSGILKILKNTNKDNIKELSEDETNSINIEIDNEMNKVSLKFRQNQIKSQIDASKTFLTF